jgi:hypothetical protein
MSANQKFGVMLTSAINTKFGIYDSQQRLDQTIESIRSVRLHIPDAKIFLIEMAGIPLTEDQRTKLLAVADHLIDFTSDPSVTELFNSTDNWDIVKNVTEVMCFRNALEKLDNSGVIADLDRIFKFSGRYLLNEHFDIGFYEEYKNKNCIVISKARNSQFSFETTGVELQYMSRLWSWPTAINKEITTSYENSLNYMFERMTRGGYADIEHCLYKFLDRNKIIEKDPIGVTGNISPNGTLVKD